MYYARETVVTNGIFRGGGVPGERIEKTVLVSSSERSTQKKPAYVLRAAVKFITRWRRRENDRILYL